MATVPRGARGRALATRFGAGSPKRLRAGNSTFLLMISARLVQLLALTCQWSSRSPPCLESWEERTRTLTMPKDPLIDHPERTKLLSCTCCDRRALLELLIYLLSRLSIAAMRAPLTARATLSSGVTCPDASNREKIGFAGELLLRRSPSTVCDFFRGSANGQAQPIQEVFSILPHPPMFGTWNQVRRDRL
jgi:hypothetical protein